MEIRSLAYRTDLFFPGFEGIILDREGYVAIRTPSNPGFYWGNYLLFDRPPAQGDLERWQDLFRQEISDLQETKHVTFGWDSPEGEPGEAQAFVDAGFTLIESIVLTARQVQPPPKYNQEVVVRPLREDWEWEAALQNQIDCRDSIHALEDYRPFKQAQLRRYRDMQRAGLGEWFGAFLGDRVTADLGLFCMGGVGRFQSVETHPDFRRQGICGTLVHQAAQYGFKHLGAQTLVMVADEHYHAARIYESVGFRPTERQIGLEKF